MKSRSHDIKPFESNQPDNIGQNEGWINEGRMVAGEILGYATYNG